MTQDLPPDLKLAVQQCGTPILNAEQRREVAVWFLQHREELPEAVCAFLELHQAYLETRGNPRKHFDTAWRELRRALGITPSSEKRPSGSPLAALPRDKAAPAKSPKQKAEEQIERAVRLGGWHVDLKERHLSRAKRLKEKLAKMPKDQPNTPVLQLDDVPRLEDIEQTQEQKDANAAYGRRFASHIVAGNDVDPALQSVNETLIPGGAVLAKEEAAILDVEVPTDLAGATVVKDLSEQRVRYDFAVTVTRIDLDVEKKVVVDEKGERHVLCASTSEYGPPRYAVTWSALATLAVMVGQFAMPFNRLATMLSTAGKRFTAGSLSRMLHYVAERLLPIYLQLAVELADSDILAGDDTSCRVLEVADFFFKSKADAPLTHKDKPPWADFQTPEVAEASLERCIQAKRARQKRRADGDRDAKRTSIETPSLGILIGRRLAFESTRRNGDGAKQSMNTTVVSGRSVAADPRSLIVFYRSHLGGCGNLFESLLRRRNRKARDVVLQGDLSSTNLVSSPELNQRFNIKTVGCSAHARRPFANYEHEDPVRCSYLLHLFLGFAIHEQQLDIHGRNRDNVLAVRQHESRELWNDILAVAKEMTETWSKETKLGAGARYIIKHFDKLTAYLDDPRLEPTNNLRERMLRMEKLIEGSSMFRRSLEGRFALDVVRTLLQTAVAAGVPVHEYLVSILRADAGEVTNNPERFTPRAWAMARANAQAKACSTKS